MLPPYDFTIAPPPDEDLRMGESGRGCLTSRPFVSDPHRLSVHFISVEAVSIWRVRNQMLLPVREEPQNPISLEFISLTKHSNFENRSESAESRAPERNGPFGENEPALPIGGLESKRENRRCYWA
jgi:hypothetical protein